MKTILSILLFFPLTIIHAQSAYKINPSDLENPRGFGITMMEIVKSGNSSNWSELVSDDLKKDALAYTGIRITYSSLLTPLTGKYPVSFKRMPIELDTCKNEMTLILDDEIGIKVTKENNRYYITNTKEYRTFTRGFPRIECR